MTARITAERTWQLVASLIGGGLPAPCMVAVYEDTAIMAITTTTAGAHRAWATALDAQLEAPRRTTNGGQSHTAYTRNWHGWSVNLAAYPGPDAITSTYAAAA